MKGKVIGSGDGRTKKEAEQHAARNALERMNVPLCKNFIV